MPKMEDEEVSEYIEYTWRDKSYREEYRQDKYSFYVVFLPGCQNIECNGR
jgi:hypothetical protein